jgi:hypothetical protein
MPRIYGILNRSKNYEMSFMRLDDNRRKNKRKPIKKTVRRLINTWYERGCPGTTDVEISGFNAL